MSPMFPESRKDLRAAVVTSRETPKAYEFGNRRPAECDCLDRKVSTELTGSVRYAGNDAED
jgi:hypothetical protein